MIERFHHVSLSVTDLERSKRFYSEVLGLPEIPRPPFDFPGAWSDLGNAHLHLIVHAHPRSLRGTTAIDSRDGHFALRIADWDAAVARLEAHGIAFIQRPDNPTPFAQIHLADPDGNGIELNVDRAGGV